jgi:hypothetical protein
VLKATTWAERVPENEAATAANMAPLVGYDAFVRAANWMLRVLDRVQLGHVSATPQELRSSLLFVADAVELITQPRIHEGQPLTCEARVAHNVKALLSVIEPLRLDKVGTRRLKQCWLRLKRSGVPKRRGFACGFDALKRTAEITANAAAAASAAPGLRTCGLESCGAREQHPKHFRPCSACRGVAYCCDRHKSEDWPSHKAACKAARKVAAENAG